MTQCPICGRRIHAGALGLCGECREQIISLKPEDQRYIWFVRALGRALRNAAAF